MIRKNIQDARIGFIGLGKMGHPMALNLLKAGYQVTVFNRSLEKTREHEDAGARIAISVADLAKNSDIAITMISDDSALKHLALGKDGIIANAPKGAIFIDMSTVSPAASMQVTEAADKRAIAYLRSPVNGSVIQAQDGVLVILSSGSKDTFDFIYPVFEVLGNRIFYLGSDEQARYLKLAINTMVGISSAMMGEALTFGEAGGLDWNTMIDVIGDSAVGSPVVKYKIDTLKKRDFTPAFTALQMAKDFGLVLDTAKDNHVPMPITSLVSQNWSAMIGNGRGSLDFFAYVEMLEEMAGLKK